MISNEICYDWQDPKYASENVPLITVYLNNSRLFFSIGRWIWESAVDVNEISKRESKSFTYIFFWNSVHKA